MEALAVTRKQSFFGCLPHNPADPLPEWGPSY